MLVYTIVEKLFAMLNSNYCIDEYAYLSKKIYIVMCLLKLLRS